MRKKIASLNVKLIELQRDIQHLSVTQANNIMAESTVEKKSVNEPHNDQNVIDEHGQRRLADDSRHKYRKAIVEGKNAQIYEELAESLDGDEMRPGTNKNPLITLIDNMKSPDAKSTYDYEQLHVTPERHNLYDPLNTVNLDHKNTTAV